MNFCELKKNTLDLFLISEVDRVRSTEVHAPFPKYRHTPVVCEYSFNSDLNADAYDDVQPKYLWHREDYCRLSDALSRVDWEMEFIYLSVDSAYEVLLTFK